MAFSSSATRAGDDDRQQALAPYDVLDTSPEAEFDDIAELACDLCGTGIALVSLIDGDRQWFKAKIGTDRQDMPFEQSICMHALDVGPSLVIPDPTLDPRTRDKAVVTGEPFLRFYAGARLVTREGVAIGTICVMDLSPRPDGLTDRQRRGLERLAGLVMTQLDLRRAVGSRNEAEIRHRQILDSAIDYGIITLDRQGAVTSWNIGAERILGWTEDEVRGRAADVFFTPEDVADGIPSLEMRHAREDGRALDERWHLRKDGSRFFATGKMMPLTSAAGDRVGYLKILRDRTRQREIDRRLRVADERLQIALEASGVVGLWDWMVDTDLLHGDANFARLYGLDPARTSDGLTMEEYQEFVVPVDLPELRRRIRDTFERGGDVPCGVPPCHSGRAPALDRVQG